MTGICILLLTPMFSPSRRLYPPACKPYWLEAEPEAIIPFFQFFTEHPPSESNSKPEPLYPDSPATQTAAPAKFD